MERIEYLAKVFQWVGLILCSAGFISSLVQKDFPVRKKMMVAMAICIVVDIAAIIWM